MELLILRHGIAEDRGPDGGDDSRRLTDEGVKKTREAARGLAKFTDAPGAILASPKVRAAQTAEILAQTFGVTVETLPALGGASPQSIAEALSRREESVLMIVGHEPTLGDLVGRLCTQGKFDGFVEMKKAGCACMDVDWSRSPRGATDRAKLLWLATPGMLRAIA